MRLVQVVIPAGKREIVLETLEEEGIDYVLSDESSNREYDAVVSFPLPTNAVEPILDELRNVGIERDAYTVVTEAQTVASERFEQLEAQYAEEESEDRIARDELRTKASDLASTTSTYTALTIVSAVVATAGLLIDSPATVVGSMVIAPLIGPAMASCVGTVIDDDELFSRGVKLQTYGMVLSVLSAAAFAFTVRQLNLIPPGLAENPASIEQVRQRIAPDFLSLAVALGAGVAGALSLTTGVSAALVGVMIAVALVPPAATVGIGIAYGQPAIAFSSGVLATVNWLSINLAALLVLWWAGYRPEKFFEERDAQIATVKRVGALLVAIAVLSVFLGGVTYDTYTNALDERAVRDAITADAGGVLAEEAYRDVTLVDLTVETRTERFFFHSPETVVVTVGVPPGEQPTGLAARIDTRIEAVLDQPVTVQVRYVEVEQSDPSLGSPDLVAPTPAGTAGDFASLKSQTGV